MPRKRAWSKLPVREVLARMLPSQQSASYDDDETQDMQDELYILHYLRIKFMMMVNWLMINIYKLTWRG
jgi:hypothetical protein